MSPAMSLAVDEIVVISLRESEDRRLGLESQIPAGVRWRYHMVDRDPEGGRAGCYRSHAAVLQDARLRGSRRVLVLEDDARLVSDDWQETVRVGNAALDAVESKDPAWTFLCLGVCPYHSGPAEGPIRRLLCGAGTHAYVANVPALKLPLPAYDGRHIDQFLFCHYSCMDAKENVSPEVYGDNLQSSSALMHRFGPACEEHGEHVFASVPLLFVQGPYPSSINPLHAMGVWVHSAVGPENNVAASVLGLDLVFWLFLAAAGTVSALSGAALARRQPARRPELLVALLAVLVPVLLVWPSWDAPTPCSRPCHFMLHVPFALLALLVTMCIGAMSYAVTSKFGALHAITAVALAAVWVGWFGLLVTDFCCVPHILFAVLFEIGTLLYLRCFVPDTAVAVILALGLLSAFVVEKANTEVYLAWARSGAEPSDAARCEQAGDAHRLGNWLLSSRFVVIALAVLYVRAQSSRAQ